MVWWLEPLQGTQLDVRISSQSSCSWVACLVPVVQFGLQAYRLVQQLQQGLVVFVAKLVVQQLAVTA